MWGIIKAVGLGVGILMAWLMAEGAEQKQRENEEFEERFREGLEDKAQELYGKPYPTLNEKQRQAVFDALMSEW